jgi:hypothetical protein
LRENFGTETHVCLPRPWNLLLSNLDQTFVSGNLPPRNKILSKYIQQFSELLQEYGEIREANCVYLQLLL